MAARESSSYTAVTTEIVIFTVDDRKLRVLLVIRNDSPFSETWALPGRYLVENQGIDVCARRELEDNAGLMDVYLEQLYSFGRPNRMDGARVVSVAHFAIVPPHRRVVYNKQGRIRWFSMNEIPPLPFDHDEIVDMGHKRLQDKLAYTTIALQFMAQQFTLGELQSVYETILGEKLDKRNFRKRIRLLDCLEETGRMARIGSYRPAKLYRPRNPGQVAIIG